MQRILVLSLLSFLSLPALAQSRIRQGAAHLESFTVELDGRALACAELEAAQGSVFYLLASLSAPGEFELENAFLVGSSRIDSTGRGRLRLPYARSRVAPGTTVEVCAAYGGAGAPWRLSHGSTLRLTGADDCDTLDLDHRPGLAAMQKGEQVTDQFASIGLAVSAQNDAGAHPDKAIIFDPAGDTAGADPDLHTDLGKLLIIAENDLDADANGLVDVPDDEAAGGQLEFAFADAIDLQSVTLVDIDDRSPTRLIVERAGGGSTALDVLNQGDGSVQEVELALFATDVTHLTLDLGGSGGLATMLFSPCPIRLDLDETPSGVPIVARRAGEVVSDQYACLGVAISAQNAVSGHPDLAILFDSSAPTGTDTDLASPGPGAGNDTALGLLLIIAENAIDTDGDGLIDDPDDEGDGGELVFDFAEDMRWFGATLVDIDDDGADFIDLLDSGGGLLLRLGVSDLGDNSVQRVAPEAPVSGVRRVILHLAGSGALADMSYCPVVPGE
jgi:hypothetical protein